MVGDADVVLVTCSLVKGVGAVGPPTLATTEQHAERARTSPLGNTWNETKSESVSIVLVGARPTLRTTDEHTGSMGSKEMVGLWKKLKLL